MFIGNGICKLERELAKRRQKRALYHQKRYGAGSQGREKDGLASDKNLELGFRPTLADDRGSSLGRDVGLGWRRLGPDKTGRIPDKQPGPEMDRTEPRKDAVGDDLKPTSSPDLGTDLARSLGRALHHFTTQINTPDWLDHQRPAGRESGVTHERTGTDTQRQLGRIGTGTVQQADGSRPDFRRTPEKDDCPSPGAEETQRTDFPASTRTAGRREILERLEQCVQEFGTTLVALEHLVEQSRSRLKAEMSKAVISSKSGGLTR